MSENLKLAFTIEVIDRATRQVRAVSQTVDRLTEPARRVGAAFEGVRASLGGITLSDLRNPAFNAGAALERIADTYERLGDAGNNAGKKIEASTALLGRAGFKQIQFLNGGSQAMRELFREADRLGVVLSSDTVKAMGRFNDSVDRMRLSMFGVLANAIGPAGPMLERLVERITSWTVANRELMATRLGQFIERASKGLPAFADGLSKVVTFAGRVASGADAVATALAGWPNLMAMLAGLIAGKLVLSVYSLATALGVLNVAAWANPLTWVLAAVAGLIAAVPLLIMHWDELLERLYKLDQGMPDWVRKLITNPLLEKLAGPRSGPKPEGQWEPAPEGTWETSPKLRPRSGQGAGGAVIETRDTLDIGGAP